MSAASPSAALSATTRPATASSAASRPSRPASSHAPASMAAAMVLVRFLVFLANEKNRVDGGVGALRCLDGFLERLLAAAVDAIRQHEERLASLLLFHQLVGRKVHGVVEQSAGVPLFAALVVVGRVARRRVEKLERRLHLGMRSRQILKQLDLAIEVN